MRLLKTNAHEANRQGLADAGYFQSFADYLQNGELESLRGVFPGAEDAALAAVYRNGYLRNCVDALRANFITVQALVGDEYFTHLSLKYIANFPPQKSTLVGYGLAFPDFIEQNLSDHKLAYLSSFARLDLAWLSAYFAADCKPLTADNVQHWLNMGHDIPSLHISLVASAAIYKLEYKISALWLTLKDQNGFEQAVQAPKEPEIVLVWRDSNHLINVKSLSDAEHRFISPLLNQASTVGLAAETAIMFDSKFDVSECFSVLLASNLLTSPP